MLALVTNESIKRCNADNLFNSVLHHGVGIALLERLITDSSNPRVANKYDCDCGRSPNGKCLGWHKLGEVEYKRRLALYLEKRKSKAAWVKIYWVVFVSIASENNKSLKPRSHSLTSATQRLLINMSATDGALEGIQASDLCLQRAIQTLPGSLIDKLRLITVNRSNIYGWDEIYCHICLRGCGAVLEQ